MKLFLILIFTISIISILGMLYWMYKSKLGELNLSKTSWHFKLIHWMWGSESYELKNACPYYWSIVLSLLVLPLYLIVRYGCIAVTRVDINFPTINIPSINIPTIIPPSKKEIYNKIYKNSKDILEYILIGVVLLILIYSFYILMHTLYKINWVFVYFIIFTSLFIISILIQNTFKPKWNKYYHDPITTILVNICKVIKVPFVIIGNIIEYPFIKIFKIYKDNCPPIKWN